MITTRCHSPPPSNRPHTTPAPAIVRGFSLGGPDCWRFRRGVMGCTGAGAESGQSRGAGIAGNGVNRPVARFSPPGLYQHIPRPGKTRHGPEIAPQSPRRYSGIIPRAIPHPPGNPPSPIPATANPRLCLLPSPPALTAFPRRTPSHIPRRTPSECPGVFGVSGWNRHPPPSPSVRESLQYRFFL